MMDKSHSLRQPGRCDVPTPVSGVSYRVVSTVRWVKRREGVVALCMRSGRFFAMGGTAEVLWHYVLRGVSLNELAAELRGLYRIDETLAVEDATRFLASCLQIGMIEIAREPATVGETRPQSAASQKSSQKAGVMRALAFIVSTRWAVRHRGFAAIHAVILEAESPKILDIDPATVEQAIGKFMIAEGFVPSRLGHRDCLPRALALFRFLRAMGAAVEFRIGVRESTFDAHAWISLRGVPLLDDRAAIQKFALLACFPEPA